MIEICNSNRNPLSVSNHVCPKIKAGYRINHQSFYHLIFCKLYILFTLLETCHAMSRLSSPSRAFLHLLQPLHGCHSAHIHQRVLTRQFLDRTPRTTRKNQTNLEKNILHLQSSYQFKMIFPSFFALTTVISKDDVVTSLIFTCTFFLT